MLGWFVDKLIVLLKPQIWKTHFSGHQGQTAFSETVTRPWLWSLIIGDIQMCGCCKRALQLWLLHHKKSRLAFILNLLFSMKFLFQDIFFQGHPSVSFKVGNTQLIMLDKLCGWIYQIIAQQSPCELRHNVKKVENWSRVINCRIPSLWMG